MKKALDLSPVKQVLIEKNVKGYKGIKYEVMRDKNDTAILSYIVNTRAILSGIHYGDGIAIRRCVAQNGVTMLTSLDTLRIVLDVLEEVTFGN